MCDAEIFPVMQKLERRLVEMAEMECKTEEGSYEYRIFHNTISKLREMKHELNVIMDFLKKSEWSRSLRYFVSEVVEMTDNALGQNPSISDIVKLCSTVKDLQQAKERLLRFADGDDREEEDLVGVEEVVELLLRKAVFSGKAFHHTSCIRGMRGVGKTSVARVLYNHAEVVEKFECRAWVCLSAELTRKEALIKLIQQVTDSDEFGIDEKMDNKALQKTLRRHLRGRQYFIVLDDICDDSYLEPVLRALPFAGTGLRIHLLGSESRTEPFLGKGSRLLLTTHRPDIRIMSSNYHIDYFHKMEFLNDDQSWKLLLKTVFSRTGRDDKIPKDLESKARQMLTKCNGLPLAIKEVGNHWAERRLSGIKWEEVLESIDLSATLALLELTCNNLVSKDKPCFLYLGLFKERATVLTRKLAQIWAAGEQEEEEEDEQDEEGEWKEEDEEDQEQCILRIIDTEYKDRTNGYGDTLSRFSGESIVEATDDVTPRYGAKSYRINSLFQMLSMRKVEETRHHVVYCCRDEFNHFAGADEHLVTLFFHGGGNFDADSSYWKNLKSLRILDFECFGLKALPKNISALKKLRYLGLNNNYIQELPRSLGRLKNLEVFDIEQNFMVEVPDIMIWKMINLRHLYMSNVICQKPLKIDAMKKLKTLTYISVDNWKYEMSGLEMMTSLCKLGMEDLDGNSNVRELFTSLAKLKNLRHLILRGFRFRIMPWLDKLHMLHNLNRLKLDGRITISINAGSFHPNIVYLTLVNSSLDEDPMPVLEKLERLCYLKLRNAYSGRQMVISHKGFPLLHTLCVEELWHLRNVEVESSAMEELRRLEINNCPYLESLPKGIESKRNLKKLKIVTTKRIATKIRKMGLSSKIEHVVIQP